MDTELKDLSSTDQQQLETLTIDESHRKDNHPLLNGNSISSTTTTPDIQELHKKCAAYVRNDVYGTMGRGQLPLKEKLLLGLAMLTLVPIRVVFGVLILLFYYLICRLCTISSLPNREDYAHLVGWRRSVIVQCGRFLSRAMFFNFGFYWISESVRDNLADQSDRKHHSEEPERPGAIISNHVSYLDILYHMSSSFPSFVAKRSLAKLPLSASALAASMYKENQNHKIFEREI